MKKLMVAMLMILPSLQAQAGAKSIFLQLNQAFDEAKTRVWLQKACEVKDDENLRLVNLVIQEAAYSDGSLRATQLDVASDYFSCFNAVFLGIPHKTSAEWKDWPRTPDQDPSNDNPGTMYDVGIRNSSFRAENVRVAKMAADNIAARYPTLPFHWYISYESNLNYQADAGIRTGYKDYLSQVSNYLYSVAPRSVLWSPTFWTPYESLTPAQRESLTVAVSDVFASSPRINRVDFQDFIGQASTVTCVDGTNCLPWQSVKYKIDYRNTYGYWALMRDAQARAGYTVVNLMVNMELFITQRRADGSFVSFTPGDPVEIKHREEMYADRKIPIGASWEIRYWYLSNFGVPEVEWKYSQ